MKWSDITPLKVMAVIIIANGTVIGGANYLKDLFDPKIVTAIVAVASLGNIFFGALVGMFSTQNNIISQVQAMPGVDKIMVNAQANPALAQMAMGDDAPKVVPLPSAADAVSKIAKSVATLLLIAFLPLTLLAMSSGAHAQGSRRQGPQIIDPFRQIKNDIDQAKQKAATDTTNNPDVSCDFRIFLGLTPANLESTIKKCVSDVNSTLADDTARALDSAQNFKPNPDQDAINCLQPGLALLRAGIQVPAVPAKDAVPATATTPEIPAVPAQPAKEPGVILLFQKYREFVLAGALTSCKTWVDTPLNATATQAINNVAGVGAAAGAAAILAPKLPIPIP